MSAPDKPPRCSVDGEHFRDGLYIMTVIACAFILGLIVGTLIWT